MNASLTPFIWVAIAFPVLLLMQRWINTHLHGISLLLTGHQDRATIFYALILFPGVLLHELSHWVTATLLGVRTGRVSLIPRRQADGTLQLGYVEYYKGKNLGPIRESLIGGAPLIVGTAVILLIAFKIFSVTDLVTAVQSGSVDILTLALRDLFDTPYILLWIYLIFAISNAMLPSKSDRRAWPAFIILMVVLTVILYFLGLSDEILQGLTRPAATVFGYLGIALSVAIGANLFFMFCMLVVEWGIGRLKGISVVYGASGASKST